MVKTQNITYNSQIDPTNQQDHTSGSQKTKQICHKEQDQSKKEPNYNRHRKFVIKLICTLDQEIQAQREKIEVKSDDQKKKKASQAFYILNKIKASYNPVKKVNKRGKSSKNSGRSSNCNITNLLWPFLQRIYETHVLSKQSKKGDSQEDEQILAYEQYWGYYLKAKNGELDINGGVNSDKKYYQMESGIKIQQEPVNFCQRLMEMLIVKQMIDQQIQINNVNDQIVKQKIKTDEMQVQTKIQIMADMNESTELSLPCIQNQNIKYEAKRIPIVRIL